MLLSPTARSSAVIEPAVDPPGSWGPPRCVFRTAFAGKLHILQIDLLFDKENDASAYLQPSWEERRHPPCARVQDKARPEPEGNRHRFSHLGRTDVKTAAAHSLRAGFVAAFASAALFSTTVAAAPISFRAAHSSTPSSTGHKAFEFLDKELREKSGGRIGLEIFPNSQLGGRRELVENIQFGNVDLTFVSSAPVASLRRSSLPSTFRSCSRIASRPTGSRWRRRRGNSRFAQRQRAWSVWPIGKMVSVG